MFPQRRDTSPARSDYHDSQVSKGFQSPHDSTHRYCFSTQTHVNSYSTLVDPRALMIDTTSYYGSIPSSNRGYVSTFPTPIVSTIDQAHMFQGDQERYSHTHQQQKQSRWGVRSFSTPRVGDYHNHYSNYVSESSSETSHHSHHHHQREHSHRKRHHPKPVEISSSESSEVTMPGDRNVLSNDRRLLPILVREQQHSVPKSELQQRQSPDHTLQGGG